MERTVTLAGVLVLVCVVVIAALFIVRNPINAERATLEEQLAKIKPIEVQFDRPETDIAALQQKLSGKPHLWEQLLPPPAPPPPPPPVPPKLDEMTKTLSFGRQQVGGKVKVTKAGEAKGSYVGVGDSVNGLTVKEISKTAVVLSLQWQGQELTIRKNRR